MMRLFLMFLILMGHTVPLWAASDDPNIDTLKTLFGELMDSQKSAAAARGFRLLHDGDLHIEHAGSYYAVTLPHAALHFKDGNNLDIGMVAINATPHKAANQWIMSVAIPTPLTLKDTTGTPLITVTIGAQKANGLWNNAIGYFTKLKAEYNKITIKNLIKDSTLHIAAVTTSADLSEAENGTWSGPLHATIDKASYLAPDSRMKVSLGHGAVDVRLLSYDPTKIADNRKNFKSGTGASPPIFGFPNFLFDVFTKGGDGFSSHYSIRDFEIIAPQEGYDSLTRFKIGKASAGLDISGLLQNKANMALNFDLDTLDYLPLKEETAAILPQEIHYDLQLNNVPFQDIADMGKNTLQGAGTQPGLMQMAGLSLLFKLPALLSQSGTNLEIKENLIRNDTYEITLDGQAVADIKALNNLTADFTILVYDYDFLLQALRKAGKEQQGSYNKQIQALNNFMIFAKGFSVKEKTSGNQDFHRFHFQVTPQGRILMNGEDINILNGFIGLSKTPSAQ